MLKKLKLYYVFVSLPFVLLIFGSIIFWGAIMSTIDKNPHPQINYTIFVVIIGGGIIILFNAVRLMREAKSIVEFSAAMHAKTNRVAKTWSRTIGQNRSGRASDSASRARCVRTCRNIHSVGTIKTRTAHIGTRTGPSVRSLPARWCNSAVMSSVSR